MTDMEKTRDEDKIRDTVARLARRHPSGGQVIERAAILAEGTDSSSILAWVIAHEGQPEALPAAAAAGGLHGGRMTSSVVARNAATPQRYVLPPGQLP
jgi:hypothetical protein